MRTHGRLMPLGIIVVGALVLPTAVKSQAVAPQNVWEYALVTTALVQGAGEGPGSVIIGATICYATLDGCRLENITAKTSSPSAQPGLSSLMAAAAKLGSQGWEFTVATDTAPYQIGTRVMYFRRQVSK